MKKLRVLVLLHEAAVPPDDFKSLPADEREYYQAEYDVVSTLRALGHEVWPVGLSDDLAVLRAAIVEHKPDISFNILEEFHGLAEFDQHVVSYLELLKLPYTGSNPRGLTLARDKALTKKILDYHRVPVPRFAVFPAGRKVRRPGRLRFPLLVKPLSEEGSAGIAQASVVTSNDELAERVSFVHRKLGTEAIAEEYIEGREIYVAIVGNDRLQAFPIWEMTLKNLPEGAPNIATLKVKWDLGYQKRVGVHFGRAKGLTEEQERAIAHQAKRIYRALGLSGYARLDMRLRADGRVFLIEANPNPQLSREGEFAESARAGGVEYRELLHRIIALGLQYRRAFWA